MVLGCLALIIIPLLLDGDGVEPVRIYTEVPAPPDVSSEPVPEPERPLIIADEPVQPTIQPEEARSLPAFNPALTEPEDLEAATLAEPDITIPAFDSQGLPESWSVRIGIFGDAANARGLLSSLLDQGYKAYTEPVPAGDRIFTGVFVGPVLTRAEANSLKSELDENLGEETLVTRFSIEELQ